MAFLAGVASVASYAQSVIRLNEEPDGRYTMGATVNGVGVRTYYAPESWFASMSSTTYLFLYENGYIANADVNGMTVVKMPNGSTTKAGSFVIRNLRIGNIIVKDLPAFVIAKQNVPLLIGNSAFDCFGTVTQEGTNLIIDDRLDEEIAAAEQGAAVTKPDTAVSADEDPLESLKTSVQAHLESKDYTVAAAEFEQLQRAGVLTMYSEYQYAMVLNILRRSDDCIALIKPWIEANVGKSLTLDYWMYDALGDCYARKKDSAQAIKYYHAAVDTYCKMFNTTEKEIKKSNFRDETLSYTLYDLAKQYSSTNIAKTEYYSALAAKSGNKAAIEFCKQCHIRY